MYELEEALERIENEIIDRLMKQITADPYDYIKNGDINNWRIQQIRALEEFKQRNKKEFTEEFVSNIDEMIEQALLKQYRNGSEYVKGEINRAIKKGLKTAHRASESITGEFSGINDRKLKALMRETKVAINEAMYSAVRYAEDIYKQMIFDAQVAFNTGLHTLSQSIDMATRDFLASGINSITYKNGAQMNIQSYSEMVLRTSNKRAYMQGESRMRDEHGLNLVIVTRRGNACPVCMKYVGRVFVDDVYSNIKINKNTPQKYPYLSSAIREGLYHPNCRDTHTTYFEGITTERPEISQKEQQEANRIYQLEQEQRYNERHIRKYARLAEYSTDENNKAHYKNLKKAWQSKNAKLVKDNPELSRKYYREKNRI